MSDEIGPEQIIIETDETTSQKGSGPALTSKHSRIQLDTIDVVAFGAVITAIILSVGMVAGVVPINDATLGVVGLAGISGVVGGVRTFRKQPKAKK
jgi:hypothetical protein